MDSASKFVVHWKLLMVVAVPLAIVAVGLFADAPLLVLAAVAFLALGVGVGWLFARYVTEAL